MTSLIVGALAVGLLVAGGVVFAEQIFHWAREHEWRTVTLRALVLDDLGAAATTPALGWLRQSHGAWYELVIQFLDAIPLWIFLVLVGGYVALRVGRVRS